MDNESQIVERTRSVHLHNQRTEAELFADDPLISAVGIAKELWADEHADEYVARLRKDW
jgi:hypothetical protein